MSTQPTISATQATQVPDTASKTWAPTGMLLLLLLVFVVTSVFANNRNVSLGGTAQAIALTSFIALAIERLIELAWLTVARMKNAWWPFNQLAAEVDRRVSNINQLSEKFFSDAIVEAEKLKGDTASAVKLHDDASKWIAEFQKEAEAALKDVKDNDRVAAASQSLFTSAAKVELLLGRSAPHVALVQQAAVGLADFTASVKDNPAKRMLSILFGSTLGMLITLTLGLDAISASLYEGNTKTFASWSFWIFTLDGVGVALTGILLGFGAAPTHEVLKALEQIRKARAASINPDPQVGTAASIVGQIARESLPIPPVLTSIGARPLRPAGNTVETTIDNSGDQGDVQDTNSSPTPKPEVQPESQTIEVPAGQTVVILDRPAVPVAPERVTYAKFNR